jgi:hypothetical protein
MNFSLFDWTGYTSSTKRFVLITSLLCIGYYILESINGRSQMADFRVYYDAARALLNDTPMYGEAFGIGSGYYKYSPIACFPFIPFTLLPYTVASVLYYFIVTYSIIWFSLRLWSDLKLSSGLMSNSGWALFVISIFMADHLERELHLGNVNLFLLMIAYQIFLLVQNKKDVVAGILFGVLLLFKPHFLILLPYFIWKKKLKVACLAPIFFLVGLFIPALLKGFSFNWSLLIQWKNAIADHNVQLSESPNTIYGILNRFVLNHHGGQIVVFVVLSAVALIVAGFILSNQRKLKNKDIRFLEYFLLVALIPNLMHTDTEHFMWTWPLIAFVFVNVFAMHFKDRLPVILLMALAFFPYCLNTPDIVGKKIAHLCDEGGLLGLANLIIIGAALWVYKTRPMQKVN